MQPRDLHKPPQQTSPLASCLRGICLLLFLGLAYVAVRVQPTEGPSAVYEHTPALRPVGGTSRVAAPRSVVADLSAAATVSARELAPRPSQTSHISLPPPPAPAPPSAMSTTSDCAHVLDPSMCPAWVRARDHPELPTRSLGLPPQRPQRCEADCHGRGVCNAATGVCACRAGYNGSACGTLNPRPCNGGKNDGLWHGSHCAGECDELTGFCWCPGRLRVRPMGESCQPQRMPLDVYAALELYTDIWEGTSADGKRVLDPCPAKDRAKQQARKAELDRRVIEIARDRAASRPAIHHPIPRYISPMPRYPPPQARARAAGRPGAAQLGAAPLLGGGRGPPAQRDCRWPHGRASCRAAADAGPASARCAGCARCAWCAPSSDAAAGRSECGGAALQEAHGARHGARHPRPRRMVRRHAERPNPDPNPNPSPSPNPTPNPNPNQVRRYAERRVWLPVRRHARRGLRVTARGLLPQPVLGPRALR